MKGSNSQKSQTQLDLDLNKPTVGKHLGDERRLFKPLRLACVSQASLSWAFSGLGLSAEKQERNLRTWKGQNFFLLFVCPRHCLSSRY